MVSARPVIAVAAVCSLGFWFIEIDRAFGLPAHPLLIHAPLVFVPILGLAALALAANSGWFDRHGVLRGRVRRGDSDLHAAGRRSRRGVSGGPGTG